MKVEDFEVQWWVSQLGNGLVWAPLFHHHQYRVDWNQGSAVETCFHLLNSSNVNFTGKMTHFRWLLALFTADSHNPPKWLDQLPSGWIFQRKFPFEWQKSSSSGQWLVLQLLGRDNSLIWNLDNDRHTAGHEQCVGPQLHGSVRWNVSNSLVFPCQTRYLRIGLT